MNSEVLYASFLALVLFFFSTVFSIFAEDIRTNIKNRWRNRKLRGSDLRLARLRSELAELEYYIEFPAAATAMFWSGFYILAGLALLMLMFIVFTYQLSISGARGIAGVFAVASWLVLYTFVVAAHRKANRLSRPDIRLRRIRAQISETEFALASERA